MLNRVVLMQNGRRSRDLGCSTQFGRLKRYPPATGTRAGDSESTTSAIIVPDGEMFLCHSMHAQENYYQQIGNTLNYTKDSLL
jgi:hypothetical protein